MASTVSPMYIAEIAPARLRGRLVVVNQLAIVIGLSLSVFVAYLFSVGDHWRWMFATQGVPVACLLVGLAARSRKPPLAGRRSAALQRPWPCWRRSTAAQQAETELREIQDGIGRGNAAASAELLRPGIRVAVVIGIVLMVLSQINGVNMILLYTPTCSWKPA